MVWLGRLGYGGLRYVRLGMTATRTPQIPDNNGSPRSLIIINKEYRDEYMSEVRS